MGQAQQKIFYVCKILRIPFKAYASHSPRENKRAEQAPIACDVELGKKNTRKSSVWTQNLRGTTAQHLYCQ